MGDLVPYLGNAVGDVVDVTPEGIGMQVGKYIWDNKSDLWDTTKAFYKMGRNQRKRTHVKAKRKRIEAPKPKRDPKKSKAGPKDLKKKMPITKVWDQGTGYVKRVKTGKYKKKRKVSKFRKLVKDVKRLKKQNGSKSYYTVTDSEAFIMSSTRNNGIDASFTLNSSRKVIYDLVTYWDASAIESAIEKGKAQDKTAIDADDQTSNPGFYVVTKDEYLIRNMSKHGVDIQYVKYGVKEDTATQPLQGLSDYNGDHGYTAPTVVVGEASTPTTSRVYRFMYTDSEKCQQKFLSHIGKSNSFKQESRVHSLHLQPGDKIILRRYNSFKYKSEYTDRNTDAFKRHMGGFIVSCLGDLVCDSTNTTTIRQTGFSDHELHGYRTSSCNFVIDNGLGHDRLEHTATALPTMNQQEEPKEDHVMETGPF